MKAVSDYALIGDMRTAALIRNTGSIEWFCAPRFDSEASFADLLGDGQHGVWHLGPRDPVRSTKRRYLGATLVLETTFTTDSGRMTLIDFMPLLGDAPAIVRIAQCDAGSVACSMDLSPKMKYGLIAPWTQEEGDAWTARVAPDGLCLRSSVATDKRDRATCAAFTLEAGGRAVFTLQTFSAFAPTPIALDAHYALEHTIAWWETWARAFRYEGEHRDLVLRSALTLKALSFDATGAFVAAATTSLPEKLGGDKNWDYRYCWLRDASFSVEALLQAGFADEARRWRDWFVAVCVGLPEHLHIMYEVDGGRLPSEQQLGWLSGFEHSAPVQVANGANDQFQLGVYGHVLTSFESAQRAGLVFDAAHWTLIEAVMHHVETVWQCPGNGIWETRAGGRQYVDSKVMAWVALDRGLALAARGGFATDVAHWRRLLTQMRTQICSAGFDQQRNTFTQYYGSRELDASVLLIPLMGFLPFDDERILGTVAAIEQQLVVDGHVYRYTADRVHAPDGTLPTEGAFTMCGFWLVQVYVAMGRYSDAQTLFERLLRSANDVGLFSEQFDVVRGVAIGNMPQAFSHVGLINAAFALARYRAGEKIC